MRTRIKRRRKAKKRKRNWLRQGTALHRKSWNSK
jgi:hypothetical protein